MPLNQNPVTRFGCVGFSTYACGFSVPQMRQFCLLTYPPRSKWASSEKMILLPTYFWLTSVSRSQAHLAKRKRIGWSIGFNSSTNWTLYGVIPRSLCKIRLNYISEMFNYWERRWIDVDGDSRTLSATAAVFSIVRTVFGFHRWGCQFLSLFAQDNEHTEQTVFLFFQNPYAIFAHILQYYHGFQSNFAIFPSLVQAYTQLYSFGGRIKLIICQTEYELSVTIHEISTSWKKTLDGGPNIYLIKIVFNSSITFFHYFYYLTLF